MTRARPGSKWSMDGHVQALGREPAGGKFSGMMCACMSTIIGLLLSSLRALALPARRSGAWRHRDYSITWWARPNTDDGTARAMALAAFKLIASSNLVGCSIGRS